MRENTVYLYGAVAAAPIVRKSEKTGELVYAQVRVNVGRDPRDMGDGIRYMKGDCPLIATQDPDIVKEIAAWKQYDMVTIMGTITTIPYNKPGYCPYCHRKQEKPGQLVYIHPTAAIKSAHLSNRDACIQDIVNKREFTNRVFLAGTLCNDPKKNVTKNGLTVVSFPLIVGRSVRIVHDSPDRTTDCPWVMTYGDKAEEIKKRLIRGSEVYINGCIQTRWVDRRMVCGQEYNELGRPVKNEDGTPRIIPGAGCGRMFYTKTMVTEIGGTRVEFVSNYYKDEDLERMAAASAMNDDPDFIDTTPSIDDYKDE